MWKKSRSCCCSKWPGSSTGTWSRKILLLLGRIPTAPSPAFPTLTPLRPWAHLRLPHACVFSAGLVKALQTGCHKVICVSAGGRSRGVGQLSICVFQEASSLTYTSSWASPKGTDGSQGEWHWTPAHVESTSLIVSLEVVERCIDWVGVGMALPVLFVFTASTLRIDTEHVMYEQTCVYAAQKNIK